MLFLQIKRYRTFFDGKAYRTSKLSNAIEINRTVNLGSQRNGAERKKKKKEREKERKKEKERKEIKKREGGGVCLCACLCVICL